jgi:distribution and morphology protein 31
VNIDHLQATTGSTAGPISWITSGKVDAVFDIKFPREDSAEVDITSLLNEIAQNISAVATSGSHGLGNSPTDTLESMRHASATDRIPGQRELAKPPLRSPGRNTNGEVPILEELSNNRDVVVDIDLRFRDLKAVVPLFTRDLSYVNSALVRPIVAFIK